MTVFLIMLHILVSVALIAIVLLQSGKGAEMGASFGASGSQSVFGAGGGSTFMSKLTTGAAIIFMLTSLTLAYKGAQKAAPQKPAIPPQSPMQGNPTAPAKPAQQAPPAVPAPALPKN